MIAPTWNYEFELPNGFYCFRYSRLYQIHHKKYETMTTISPIHVYMNSINNRLVFKIKYGYRPELQTPETCNYLVAQKNYRKHKRCRKYNKSQSSWSSFSPM